MDVLKKNINFVLTGLCLLFFFIAFRMNDPFLLFESTYEDSDPLIRSLTKNNLGRVEVFQGENSKVVFIKETASLDSWVVQSTDGKKGPFKADAKLINESIDRLLDIRTYQEITSNKEKYKDYQVSAENGMSLALFKDKGEKPEVKVYLGKSGSNFNSTLVRLEQEDSVYSAKGNLKSDWEQDFDYFRDKNLLQLTPENVEAYSLKGIYNYSITKGKNSAWELDLTQVKLEADSEKVNDILKKVSELKANGFHEGKVPPRIYATVTLGLSTKTDASIEIRKPSDEGDYLVRTSDVPYWTNVSKWKLDVILKKPDEIQKKVDKAAKK